MGSVQARAIGACAAVALAGALAAGAANARTTRFHAYVGGAATGAGHSFFVGDGVRLVFVDAFRSGTEYRVCWTRGAGRRCWARTSARRGHPSTIFTAAPSSVGTYRTTWYVAGRPMASWTFYNGIGD
jgi:hypothetical protein